MHGMAVDNMSTSNGNHHNTGVAKAKNTLIDLVGLSENKEIFEESWKAIFYGDYYVTLLSKAIKGDANMDIGVSCCCH